MSNQRACSFVDIVGGRQVEKVSQIVVANRSGKFLAQIAGVVMNGRSWLLPA
jgi:hypothetical protein